MPIARSLFRRILGGVSALAQARLVQFLAIGGVLFALAPAQRSAQEIRLSSSELQALQAARSRELATAALSESERRAVSARQIEDEVLYREALRLGLDRDDGVVRQRLIQKLLFLAEELEGAGQPLDEASLRACYERKSSALRRPAASQLVHVFAASPKTLAALRPQVAAWRPQPGAELALPPFGESFPLNRHVQAALTEIASQYGEDFAAALPALPVGSWSEPLPSKYGWHLVLPLAFAPERPATFEEARPELSLLCWMERREAAVARLIERSLPRYRIYLDGQRVSPSAPTRRVAARSESSGED